MRSEGRKRQLCSKKSIQVVLNVFRLACNGVLENHRERVKVNDNNKHTL